MENWQHLKVLIVDDLRIKYLVISRFLEATQIQITYAENGKIAVELCSRESFDIILMNILMPVMDGFEATKEIRKFNKDVIIIAQTNYADIREKCLETGFNDYIRNPFSKEDLINLVKQNIKY
jgi:CheY-like chemotaxis protein